MKMSTHTGFFALALALFTAGGAMAQIAGTVITTENKTIPGTIKWKVREKVYAITMANKVEIELAPANISDIQVPKPKDLDAAIASVQQGNAAAAVPVLERIVTDYLMLQWDKVATRLLADAYIKAGEPEKAIHVCEKVVAANPEAAYLGEMAPAYWQALLKANRTSKVEDLLAKAIKSGNRESSAFALTMRGDVILASGETNEIAKKALRDGFLRVVTLYRSERAAQPEALYKAAKCFDKLGQSARSDMMRTALKSEFAASEWARKP